MPGVDLVRVSDEATLHVFHGVVAATFAEDFVALPADPIEDIRPALSGRLADEPTELWFATTDGVPVVAIRIQHSDRDNVDIANVQLNVHPDHRSNGHGTSGLDAAIARARDLGLCRVHGQVPSRTREDDPAPGRGLMHKYGATPLLTERRRLLDIRTLDADVLAAHVATARTHAAGYSTLTWRDRSPDDLVADLAGLHALMSTDPPQGDLALEPEVWDAARYRAHEQSVIDRGRQRLFCGVRHDASGQLVGFTDLGVPAGRDIGYQWSTIVRAEHRGHRLGMLVKAVNLQYLLAELPAVAYLNTWNAETNTYMVSVNEALGYQVQEAWTEFGLDL